MILGAGLLGATRSSSTNQNTETIVTTIPASLKLSFSISDGINFVLHHGLNTEDLVMQMFHQGEQVLPRDMKPSGPDDIQITLDVPMDGTLLLIGL